jgi:hypothetical protein
MFLKVFLKLNKKEITFPFSCENVKRNPKRCKELLKVCAICFSRKKNLLQVRLTQKKFVASKKNERN